MAPTTHCPVCDKNITKSGSVNCFICDRWFHLKSCSKLSDVSYDLLVKKNGSIRWRCESCSSFSRCKDDDNDRVWEAINKLSDKVTDLISSLAAKIKNQIEESISKIKEDFEMQKKLSDDSRARLESNLKKMDMENHKIRHQLCRSDILVTGLPQTVEPLTMALKISQVIGENINAGDISSCFWLGKFKKPY